MSCRIAIDSAGQVTDMKSGSHQLVTTLMLGWHHVEWQKCDYRRGSSVQHQFQNSSSIRSAVLTQLMSVTDRPSDRPTDRIRVAYTALVCRQCRSWRWHRGFKACVFNTDTTRAGLRYCGALSTWQSRCPPSIITRYMYTNTLIRTLYCKFHTYQ